MRRLSVLFVLACAGPLWGAPPEAPADVTAPQDKVREIVVKVPEGKTLQYRLVGDRGAFREMKGSAKGEAVFWFISETGGRSHVVWWFLGEEGSSVTDVNRNVSPGPGPQPDPGPGPQPKPDPAPVKVDSVFVVVVEDATATRTLDAARVLNDPWWAALKAGGKHDYRHYLSSSADAKSLGYVDTAKAVGFPAVLVLNQPDGAVLKKFKLTTVSEIDAAVKTLAK